MSEIKKKAEKARNVSEQTKRERRKKANRLKDSLHRGLGPTSVSVGICLRECKNKDTEVCDDCFRFNRWEEKK